MSDFAVDRGVRAARRGVLGDAAFHGLTLLFAVLVLLILGGVIVTLVAGAWPALTHFGLGFLIANVWNPVTEKFGALAPIYGTLVTSAIAMLIAIPVAFGIALFITELSPIWLKRPLATMIELLAAIPSIIYGIWGLFVLAPFVQEHIEPLLIDTLGETMAVTFVIGNSHHIHASILQPGTTISAALANEFTEAVGDLYLSSLIALGLILFFITFIVLAIAKLLLIRLEQQAGA